MNIISNIVKNVKILISQKSMKIDHVEMINDIEMRDKEEAEQNWETFKQCTVIPLLNGENVDKDI